MSRFGPSTSPGATSARDRQPMRASRVKEGMVASGLAGEEQRAGHRTAAVRDRGHLRELARQLAVAGLAPELEDGLVDEPEPVEPPGGELAAMGVHRELAVEGDAVPPLDERPGLPLAAEAQRLQPRHGQEA